MPAQGHAPRIVVGVDGSPTSDEALRWAIRQAQLTGASVDAVTAWEYPASMGGFGLAPMGMYDNTDFAKVAADIVTAAISRVADPADGGVTVRPEVAEGTGASVLLAAADGADLLVVGSRGHGGFTAALLGSVSQHCVQHARCPVVVIRGRAHGTVPEAGATGTAEATRPAAPVPG